MIKKKELNLSEEQMNRCDAIIHSHSSACGGIAATPLSEIPLADNAIIIPIQIGMIIELGEVFDQKISTSTAQSILSEASDSLTGKAVSRIPLGWIPGIGNAINTATAAGWTETIGWMAVDRFSKKNKN